MAAEGLKEPEPVDRLSSLPDDLLAYNILPLLPMKEALRTCVLAHRWRFLWLSVPFTDLEFDASAMIARVLRDNDFLGIEDILGKDGRTASDFIQCVDRVIAHRRTNTNSLRRFCVRFHLDSFFNKEIDSWIRFALEQEVHVLELDCCQPDFPDCYFRAVGYPRLRFLTSLTLRGVELHDEDMERLLRESQSLKRLHLCTIMGLSDLNITGPVSSLRYIYMSRHCRCVCRINITAPTPHLLSLTYPDTTRLAHLKHAPQLVDAFFHDTDDGIFDHPLFPYFSQLHTLHLRTCRFGWSPIESWTCSYPHHLSGLKQLKLSLGYHLEDLGSGRIFDLTFLIKAAPSLQHLTLMLEVDKKQNLKMAFAQLDLHSIRVLEIVGFQGGKEECDFVQHMVKGGISLEEVIIDCRCPVLLGNLLNEYGVVHYAGVGNDMDHIVQQRQESALLLIRALVLPNKLTVKLRVI